ncbi:uncharacterized protein LOC124309534 [Neodiprion virginianus]|uniref:uncharacterized protein LOC124309534 n=1 Tax=Neodiprion virginianus TaxID=2961670 RepID=UPI001EE6D461|nr:uncharacterized protein LOC124309534 [Neodiprion virginianus]XP_046629173.1 uncharacterized protein LOC124309534 [Neodiprion virginianus]
MKLLLTLLGATTILADPEPGLLRVPRVYNALVTSNQNLSPSRAFPVIQPVVHTTAVGYVPPFYYTQFAPQYPGPEAGRLPQELLPANGAGPDEGAPSKAAAGAETRTGSSGTERNLGSAEDETRKRKAGAEHPLSFYPNYHSLYYDPYFYSYNSFNARVAPSPYIFDYQPPALAPALSPQGAYRGQQLLRPRLPVAGPEALGKNEAEEKIPDVPPPPVPTSSSNKS